MSEIASHYEQVPEDDRLNSGFGQLELARTQELILRHLPAPPLKVLDTGGGAGVYSAWLGALGYEAHLVDLIPRHVESARRVTRIASANVGDARQLLASDNSFQAVLLLGPLYHLNQHDDRLAALREAFRVLQPNGIIFAAAICRFASLMDGLARGFIDDPRFQNIMLQDLANGRHENPTDKPEYFTTAFFHRPEELYQEMLEAGFSQVEVLPIEGPMWLALNFERRWMDAPKRDQLLSFVRKIEREPDLLGVSPHLLAIGRRK
jgi:ubiquinone/menaquinone biosynthesis C-methylase UbiE